VTEAICRAVEDDWRAEVPDTCVRRLGEALGDRQLSLLGDSRAAQFAAIRRSLKGCGSLGGVFVDCAEETAASGKFGDDALREAVENAVSDRVLRSARQVEEHYHRHSTGRGLNIRNRLAEAITGTSLVSIVNRVLQVGDRPVERLKKQQGLDDGVPLP
jgi:hypothetical protein